MLDPQSALRFASGPGRRIDRARVEIAQVDLFAARLRDPGGQGHADARRLDPGRDVVAALSLDVRAVRQDAARDVFEAVPLLHKVIAHMVPDGIDQRAVRDRDLVDVRGVDDHLAAVGDDGLGFVHRLGRRPQVVIDRRRHREHARERARRVDHVELRRQIGGGRSRAA